MLDVHCNVEGQSLSIASKPEPLVAGSKGLLRLRFSFGSDWNGWKAAVDFGSGAVPVVGNRCLVPDDIAAQRSITFNLIGAKEDKRIVTRSTTLIQKEV